MKKRSGLTLIELMVAMALTAILTLALVRAYGVALTFGPHLEASRAAVEEPLSVDTRIETMLRGAWISTVATERASFFTTDAQNQTPAPGSTRNANQVSNQLGSSQQTATNVIGNSGSPSLVWTSVGEPPGGNLTNDTTDDFETINTNYGPNAGPTEYSLSLTPVGDAQGRKGLFIRTQRPADGDATQGGKESLLVEGVDSLTFEFWDGTQWQPKWSTLTQTTKRLPAAVRVTYSTNGSNVHAFVVRLPLSNVTTANPVATGQNS